MSAAQRPAVSSTFAEAMPGEAMNRRRLHDLLQVGERKELGRAPEVSAAIRSGKLALADLLRELEGSADDDVVVSHGMHALRTAVESDPAACRKAIRWLGARLDAFLQWEAREQFCRMVVAHPPRPSKALLATLTELMASRSSIVAAYALEARVGLAERDEDVDRLLVDGLAHERAAVRARARKLDRARR